MKRREVAKMVMEIKSVEGCQSCNSKELIKQDRLPFFKNVFYELRELDGLFYAVGSSFSIYVLNVEDGRDEGFRVFVEMVESVVSRLREEVSEEVHLVFSHFFKCSQVLERRNFLLCRKQIERELNCVLPIGIIFYGKNKELLDRILVKFSHVEVLQADDRTSFDEILYFLRKVIQKSKVERRLIFKEDDLELLEKFFLDELENAGEPVYVYVGRLVVPSFGRAEFFYVKDVDCVVRGGYLFDGVCCLGVAFNFGGVRKVYVIPFGFHRLVDSLRERVKGSLNFLKRSKNDLVRYQVDGHCGKLASLFLSGNFSERFVRDFSRLRAPGEIATFLSRVEISFHQIDEFLDGLSRTSFYEISKKFESYEGKVLKVLLNKSLVVNDAERFLVLVRKILGEEGFLIEERILAKRLKLYSVSHFERVISKSFEDGFLITERWRSLVENLEQEKEEGKKLWADVYVYEGSDYSLEKGLRMVLEQTENLIRVYKKQRKILGLIDRLLDREAVLPISGSVLGSEFPFRVSLGECFLMRLFFVNQIVLPLVSELSSNGLPIDVGKVVEFYVKLNCVIENMVEYYLRLFGVLENEVIDKVISQVKEGKLSVLESMFVYKDLVFMVARDMKRKGVRPESEGFVFYIEKEVPEMVVSFNVSDFKRFRQELLFYVFISRLIKMKQFLEEAMYYVVDGRVYPYYDVDGAKTGRIIVRNPAVFRWFNGVYVICARCGAFFDSMERVGDGCMFCGSLEREKNSLLEFDFSLLTLFGLSVDLRQAELTTLAGFSGDERMIELMKGGDIYCYLGSRVLSEEYEKVWKSYLEGERKAKGVRDVGKRVAFSIVYGGLVDSVPDDFGRLKGWLKSLRELAEKEGVVATLFGKVRFLEGERDLGERVRYFINTPVQGTTAELFLLALYLLKIKVGKSFKVYFVNQDSFLGDVVDGGIDRDELLKVFGETLEEVRKPYEILRLIVDEKFLEKVDCINYDVVFVPYDFVVSEQRKD